MKSAEEQLLELLRPELMGAKDPVKVAWNLQAPLQVYYQYAADGVGRYYQMYRIYPTMRLYLLAVAELQAAGIPATPKEVAAKAGMAVNTLRRFLRMAAGQGWYRMDPPLLGREKHGRTYKYFVLEPTE